VKDHHLENVKKCASDSVKYHQNEVNGKELLFA